jgi:hypothetical protein
MPKKTSITGSELFIVDNSEEDWKVARYLHDWCQLSKAIDIATGYFEIGALLALKDEWQKVDRIRILMGDEVSARTKDAFQTAVAGIQQHLDDSIEAEKEKNDFLAGVPEIVEALGSRKIECRVYRKDKFHAKAYITHARMEVVGSSALVGSSNFTYPGLTENIELNVQITAYEGHETPLEALHLEYQKLLAKDPALEGRLNAFPQRVFSGRRHVKPGTKSVFFCYARPGPDGSGNWTESAGDVVWYLYTLADQKVREAPIDLSVDALADLIRSTPDTPRDVEIPQPMLAEARKSVEKHIKNTYLKSAQAPVGVKPVLKAWMELN